MILLSSALLACTPPPDATDPTSPGPSSPSSPSSPEPSLPTEPTTAPWCAGTTAAHDAFRALWTAFDERYAVFDAHLGDRSWSDLGDQHCAALGDAPSDEATYAAMLALLRELDDGHVNLCADAYGCEDAWVTAYPDYPALYQLELQVEAQHLDAPLAWAARDWVAWGTIGDVGYVSLTSMDGLSSGGNEGADVAAAADAMTQVLADLAASRALIVDVRANEGGWDAVSLELARWFAGDRALAWTEQVRNGPAHDDFTEPREVHVEDAHPGAFAGPVILLTSGGTFSAAETFVLAMRVRDDVTVLGEPTSGHFSDLFGMPLPNGWRVTLSGERYVAADGELYEVVGAPVDEDVPFDADALRDGIDVQLEAALALLGAR